MEQVYRAFWRLAQLDRAGQLGRGARVATGHQLDAGARMRVHVRFAAQVFDEVDDDVHTCRIAQLELLGPDAEGDLRQACVGQLGQLVAFEFQCRITYFDTVRGQRKRHQV